MGTSLGSALFTIDKLQVPAHYLFTMYHQKQTKIIIFYDNITFFLSCILFSFIQHPSRSLSFDWRIEPLHCLRHNRACFCTIQRVHFRPIILYYITPNWILVIWLVEFSHMTLNHFSHFTDKILPCKLVPFIPCILVPFVSPHCTRASLSIAAHVERTHENVCVVDAWMETKSNWK